MSELRLDNYMVQHISFYWLHKQFFEVRDFLVSEFEFESEFESGFEFRDFRVRYIKEF